MIDDPLFDVLSGVESEERTEGIIKSLRSMDAAAMRWGLDNYRGAMGTDCQHKPGCPWYCVNSEAISRQRDFLGEALSLLINETEYWSYVWPDGKGRSWRFWEVQDSHASALVDAKLTLDQVYGSDES
jgi:hypothetical protein